MPKIKDQLALTKHNKSIPEILSTSKWAPIYPSMNSYEPYQFGVKRKSSKI